MVDVLLRAAPEKKKTWEEDGNPLSNMMVVVYYIFEIQWVVFEREKLDYVCGCIGSD